MLLPIEIFSILPRWITFEITRDRKVPHFHHELVKKALVLAIEDQGAVAMIVALLAHCGSSALILPEQFALGVQRTRQALPDLVLDVPTAPAALDGTNTPAVLVPKYRCAFHEFVGLRNQCLCRNSKRHARSRVAM
jgi:hypothetical protein